MLVFACVSLLCAARLVAALCEKESSARQTDGQAVTSSEPLTAGNGGVETDVGTPAAEGDSTTGCNCSSSSSCPRSPAARSAQQLISTDRTPGVAAIAAATLQNTTAQLQRLPVVPCCSNCNVLRRQLLSIRSALVVHVHCFSPAVLTAHPLLSAV